MSLEISDIYQYLKNNPIPVNDNTDKDILCIICEKVLINAYNGPCGCRYCYDCISGYLGGKGKHCPGTMDECQEEIIIMNKNISHDKPINRKISRIVVKCPSINCQFQDEVRNIESHVRVCDSRSISCPFIDFGCDDPDITNENLKKHFLLEIVSHSKFMLESINNFKNENGVLKKELCELKEENKSLREEIKLTKKENENKIAELRNKFESKSKESEKLTANLNDILKRFSLMERQIKTIEEKSNVKAVSVNPQIKPDLKENEVKKLEVKISNIESKMNSFESGQSQNFGEFIWVIDKWNEKFDAAKKGVNEEIFSDGFFSHKNGYKMCLSVSPYGCKNFRGKYLSAGFCLMKGPFDDILPWPFKDNVIIDLINPEKRVSHRSCTVKYDTVDSDFNKPSADRGLRNGFHGFIPLDNLTTNAVLCSNNKLYFKCSVKPA